jgi:hypothetical protein
MNPKARKDELLIEELADETLVYDLKRHKAFCLNRTTSLVWRRCDGRSTVEEIADQLKLEPKGDAKLGADVVLEIVRFAIERLERARLLEKSAEAMRDEPLLSRRALASRLARIAGGLAVLVPAVMAVNAPVAIAAGSCISEDNCKRFPAANAGKCCCGNRRKCVYGKCHGDRC